MTDWEPGRIVIREDLVPTAPIGGPVRAVLEKDQLDLIRQIVREEIERAK